MQHSLSQGMHPTAMMGNHPLAPQPESDDGPIGGDPSRISAVSPLGQAMISLGYMDAPAEPQPTHRKVVCICEGSTARFVCDCGEDTGVHEIETAIANMASQAVFARDAVAVTR